MRSFESFSSANTRAYHAYRSGERVYHLFARKVYQAMELENLPTHKRHQLEYVKTRLVALDFILAQPEHHYLETEADKIRFFEREYGLDRAVLPKKLYRARRSAEVTPRYFVDRFPIFLDPAPAPPLPTFTYVEAGAVTLDGFQTHLRAYSRLFRSLPAFTFLYVAPTARLLGAAESQFQASVCGPRPHGKSVGLGDYFRLRAAWDGGDRLASADVVRLKDAQSRYAAKQFDRLYERWRAGGASDGEVAQFASEFPDQPKVTFRTSVCGSSLKVFSSPMGRAPESWPEAALSGSPSQVSGGSSVEASAP